MSHQYQVSRNVCSHSAQALNVYIFWIHASHIFKINVYSIHVASQWPT